jgi:hypothetical protein
MYDAKYKIIYFNFFHRLTFSHKTKMLIKLVYFRLQVEYYHVGSVGTSWIIEHCYIFRKWLVGWLLGWLAGWLYALFAFWLVRSFVR